MISDSHVFIDMDFRKVPKTKVFCAVCQKDLNNPHMAYILPMSHA